MKKYHIADVLTLSRIVVFSSLLIFFTFAGVGSGWALLFFVLGLLTDAADGEAARTWPYPKDGKKRWWRENKRYELHDKIADIILLASMIFYTAFGVLQWKVMIPISIVAAIAAVIVEIWRYFRIRSHGPKDKLLTKVVLRRRKAYLGGLAAFCLVLFWWPTTLSILWYFSWYGLLFKGCITVLALFMAIAVAKKKAPRLKEDVTPLDREAEFGQQTRKKPPKDAPRYRLGEYPQKCKK